MTDERWLLAVLALVLCLVAYQFRYSVVASGPRAYVLDRWTGDVDLIHFGGYRRRAEREQTDLTSPQ